jgi:hypothetical protein
MCPACLTTLALTVVGATSTGGVVALFARRLLGKQGPNSAPARPHRIRMDGLTANSQ